MDSQDPEEATSMLPVAKKNLQKIEIASAKTKKKSWIGVRHVQVLLLFVMFAIGYGMRINLSVGIVAMTDPSINPDVPTYDWSIAVKSNMLSAFFWGYTIPQMFAGRIAEIYGPKWFLTGMMIITSIFTALLPSMARVGAWAVILCRVIQGATQAFFLPSIQYALSKWSPISERSRLSSFAFAGGPLGTVICMPVTGWISASPLGWPYAFYLYALLGFLWTIVWVWLGANAPAVHESISDEERIYIQKTCGSDEAATNKGSKAPLKDMAKSLPFWGIFIAFCGQNWGYWTLLTEIPTYMSGVLEFDIKQNGLLSAAPYFALFVCSFFFSSLSDFLNNRKILSTVASRKLFTAIALGGPAIALFILGIIGNPGRGTAISLLIVAVAINASVYCGFQINHIDIAPNHAGTLMGVSSGASNIFSITAPLIVPYIVTDESDPDQWKIVFFIAGAIYIAACIFYTVVGRADVQYWDKLEENDKDPGKNHAEENSTDNVKV